jgi:hypothetical protein
VPRTILSGQYPDQWYQGIAAFSDVLWSIDTSQKTTQVLVSPDPGLDAIKLQVSPDAHYLYFCE